MSALTTTLLPALAWALLDFVWQGLLIGWVVALLFALLRKARPQLRYAIGCGAMLLCAALPLAGTAERLLAAQQPASSLPLLRAGAAALGGAPVSAHLAGWESTLQAQLPLVILFWSLGAAALALRLAVGLAWVRKRSRPGQYLCDPAWQACVDRLAARMGVARKVTLGLVGDVAGPMTAGCWRPLILIPASLATGMAPQLLEALLAHEMAHIRRHDYLINLLQSAIEILLFYHPTVWWLSNRIRSERELIADDLAASTLGEPRRLALALSELEQFQFLTHPLAPAAHGGHLMNRIKRLVRPHHATLSWKMLVPILGLAGACAGFYANAEPPAKKPAEWSVTRGKADIAYAVVRGSERNGSILNGSSDDWKEIDAVKRSLPGQFLWFRKPGEKAFVVRDPAILDKIFAAYAPMDKLGAEMDGYGKQMEVHSKDMEKLSAEMERLSGAKSGEHAGQRGMERALRQRERERDRLVRDMERLSRRMADGSADADKQARELQAVALQVSKLSVETANEAAVVERHSAQLEAQHAPMEALGRKMEQAGKPMEVLGKQMEALGKQMEAHGKAADQTVRELIKDAQARGLAQSAPPA